MFSPTFRRNMDGVGFTILYDVLPPSVLEKGGSGVTRLLARGSLYQREMYESQIAKWRPEYVIPIVEVERPRRVEVSMEVLRALVQEAPIVFDCARKVSISSPFEDYLNQKYVPDIDQECFLCEKKASQSICIP